MTIHSSACPQTLLPPLGQPCSLQHVCPDLLPVVQNYLQLDHPSVYSGVRYTTLEISPQLAAIQQRKVKSSGKHQECFTVVQQDALSSLAWQALDERPCVILMMEVLDNMPHDRSTALLIVLCIYLYFALSD